MRPLRRHRHPQGMILLDGSEIRGANHAVSIVDLPLGNGSLELHPTGDCLAFLKHHLRSEGLYKINKQSCYTKKIHSYSFQSG